MEVAGSYKIPHVSTVAIQVYTNTVPCGFSRAPGEFQGIFAGESHMDVIAGELGMDPFDLRMRNIIHDGDDLPDGRHFDEIRLEETLRAAAEAAGYFDPKTVNVGRGIGLGHRSQGGGDARAEVAIGPDGMINAKLSIFDTGGGNLTIMAQVVAEELGVAPEEVRVTLWSSTDEGPIHGVGASRGARATTVAAYEASQDAKQQLRRLAAEFLGWNEESITFRDGGLVNGSSGEQVSIEAIVGRSGAPVVGRGDISEQQSRFTSFGVQIAEVSVDPETGHVTLLRLTTVNETGQILNPVGFHGQIQGGIVYGLGEALMEELIVEDGRVANPSFADMKIPTQRDIPEVTTVILSSESGEGPYNVRGIGEHTNIMTAPAIANAVQDAVGVRIQQLPVTAERVYGALTSNEK